MSDDKLKLAVLASGNGSNLQALIDACENGHINGEIVLVLSDKEDAYALERGKKHRIPTKVLTRKPYGSRAEYDIALANAVADSGATLVCLAGFMRILSKEFLSPFKGWVINIHPALLPSFPGLNAQRQAIDHGVKVTGATVHFVDEGVDTGPIILQSTTPVEPDDTALTLGARILKLEHILYPAAVRLIATGVVSPSKKG